jgi:hypothetical protein
MKRRSFLLTLASIGLVLTVSQQQARAQIPFGQPGAPYSPPVSPYINLLRPGISPAVNYYGSVVPQSQFYNGLNTLQQQTTANQYGISALGAQNPLAALLLMTGHPVGFMNYRRYFMNFTPTPPLGYGGLGYGYGGYGGLGGGVGGYGGYGFGMNPFGGIGATTGLGGIGGNNPFGGAGAGIPGGGQFNRPPTTGPQYPGTGFGPLRQ